MNLLPETSSRTIPGLEEAQSFDQPQVSPEAAYAGVAPLDHRKKLGQFFTPPRVANLMADWVAHGTPATVLDPAMGTGMLLRAMHKRLPTARLKGIELDRKVLNFASVPEGAEVCQEDFLYASYEDTFDGVIMNPPYIRHREIRGYQDIRSKLGERAWIAIPKSANLYIYFTVKALLQVRRGGRAAILIPSEWLNANFSITFKDYLLKNMLLKEIVCFSACSNVFDDALTTASVLLIEKPTC